jgi:hypothetical protein
MGGGGGGWSRPSESSSVDSSVGSTGSAGKSQGRSVMAPYSQPMPMSGTVPFGSSVSQNIIQRQIELNELLEQIKSIVKEVIEDHKRDSEWDINDHGIDHARRVELNIEALSDVLESLGLDIFYLGYPLTPEQMFLLKMCAYLHDLGRAVGRSADHAQFAAEYVRRADLPLTPRQRELLARLCLLHANGTTEDVFGSEDLSELVTRRAITQEEFFLGSLLRVADALDVGKSRVQHNSQGTPRDDVMKRIKKELNPSQQKMKLSHWEGHLAIDRANFVVYKGRLNLDIRLDSKLLSSYGEQAALRVKDLVRDVTSTVITKNVIIRFRADDINKVSDWYERFSDIFYDDIVGSEVSIAKG